MTGPATKISVVVPLYNEAQRIGRTLAEMTAHLGAREHEIICVDDGSTDGTRAALQALAARHAHVRVAGYAENRGKGWAVKTGVLQTTGERILFCDADGSTPFAELGALEAALAAGADIAIGSRGLRGSILEKRQPRWREAMGRTFNWVVRLAAVPGIYDTQCGFKLFTRAAAMRVFAPLVTERYAFDVELLLRAQTHGLRIAEVPVRWRHEENSRVSIWRDAPRMLWDVGCIRWRLLKERRHA